uniref:Uncharacterized protein n=1 Tax=Gopherus agassizii TaxID=38772 RepID=A0A452GGZ5_9SAUR
MLPGHAVTKFAAVCCHLSCCFSPLEFENTPMAIPEKTILGNPVLYCEPLLRQVRVSVVMPVKQ